MNSNIIPHQQWLQLKQKHEAEADELTGPYLESKKCGHYHPGLEFLFSYFSFRPGKIRRWSPGIGSLLKSHKDHPFYSDPRFIHTDDTISITPETFPNHRRKALQWTLRLLTETQKRQPIFSCFCVHEWAMLYKEAEKRRHPKVSLRLSPEEIDTYVDSIPVQCSHYDALRFYTDGARPRSNQALNRDTQADYEQPACLHANMDLYKWAYKIYPWCSSDLLLRCFKLALDCRHIDMCSSPYDMTPYGGKAIAVETPEGKIEFAKQQQRLKKQAEPLRQELISIYRQLLLED